MPSIITYTTVVNVKRVLRSNVQKRINFSGHYRNLGGGTDNTSTIALSAVSFYDNYEKQASVILEFQTDTTNYKITSVDESTGARGEINLGTYDFETDVTTSDGMIILSKHFSGTPTVAGDRITYETEVHMSTDDLYEYLNK